MRARHDEPRDHDTQLAGLMSSDNVTGAHSGLPPQHYEIRVRGHLGATMRSAFPALQAQSNGGDTVLTGPLPDHAALHGVLAEIEALGLELLEVRRCRPLDELPSADENPPDCTRRLHPDEQET